MGEDAKDVAGHTRGGKNVKELHSLHFEAEVSIDHEKDNVGDLCNIDHGLEFVGAFDEGQSLLLGGDDRDRSHRILDGFLCISSDERLEKGGLSYARGAYDGDESWGWFIGETVDGGDMKTLLFDLRNKTS